MSTLTRADFEAAESGNHAAKTRIDVEIRAAVKADPSRTYVQHMTAARVKAFTAPENSVSGTTIPRDVPSIGVGAKGGALPAKLPSELESLRGARAVLTEIANNPDADSQLCKVADAQSVRIRACVATWSDALRGKLWQVENLAHPVTASSFSYGQHYILRVAATLDKEIARLEAKAGGPKEAA